jgi:uncharacterized protein with PQ loop repeat
MLPTIVSTLAPILTVLEVIPQLHKTVKHKRVRDLSFWTIILMFLSGLTWALHGYFIQDVALFVSSIAVIILNAIMAVVYLMFSL